MNSLRIFLFAGTLFSLMLTGHMDTRANVISFVGAIVKDTCLVDISLTTVNTECYRNGEHHTDTQKLANFDTRSRDLPLGLGTTKMKWLDKNKRLVMLTVVYR